MQSKVLSLCILGINIRSLTQMVTNLWTLEYFIGCNGKIQLWPMKSRNDDTLTLFWVCLVVFTWGVLRSHMGPLSQVVWKIYAYSGEKLLISIENVYFCCQRSNLSGWCRLTRSSTDVSLLEIKTFQIQRWQFVPPSRVPNIKTFYDPVDLENKVKVKLMTCSKRSCHYAS